MTQFQLPTISQVANPQGWGYGARLDELLLRLAVGPDRTAETETAQAQAQRIQTESNPENFVPESGQPFSRSDFSGGEGLDFAHRRQPDPNDSIRFWDSVGVDVFSKEPGQIRSAGLLLAMETIASTGTDSAPHMVLHPDGYLLRVSGNNVLKVATPSATPSVTTEDPFPSYAVDVESLVQVGDDTFATGAGASALLSKRNAAGTWSELATALNVSSKLWYVKGRLMGAVDETLHVIDQADGTTDATVHILPSGETWAAIVDAGPIILAAGGGRLYMFEDQSGTLTIVNQESVTATDEPIALAYASGVLLIGTREPTVGSGYLGRLYRASIGASDTSFVLRDIQLLRSWDPPSGSGDASPCSFLETRDSIYMIVWEGATEVNMWRYYLPTGGLARDRNVSATVGGLGAGLVVYDDLFFASSGGALLARDDDGTYVDEGYVITPLADHYTAITKSWLGITTHIDGIDVGGEAEVLFSIDPEALTDPTHISWTRAQLLYSPNDSGIEINLAGVQSRWLAMMVKLRPGTSNSPRLRSVASRAFTDSADVIFVLPVNISDRIERPGRTPMTVPGWGNRLYSELLSREGGPVTLERYNPAVTVTGTLEKVRIGERHHPHRGSAPDYAMIVVRGKVTTAVSQSSSAGQIGIGLLGVELLGV
jgi:hypothetical protein